MIALRRPGKDGIWGEERIRCDLGTKKPTRLKVGAWSALGLGMYFSVLSAFHIGWCDLNVGNWIARIQLGQVGLRRAILYQRVPARDPGHHLLRPAV